MPKPRHVNLLRILSLALLLTLLLAALTPAAAQGVQVRTTNPLHLRGAASTASQIITTIPPDTVIAATGISWNYRWLRVSYSGLSGWVARQYTVPEAGSIASLPISYDTLPPAVLPLVEPIGDTYVAPVVDLNMRMEPHHEAELIVRIPRGTRLIADTTDFIGRWVLVRWGTLRGWVNGTYLNIVGGQEAFGIAFTVDDTDLTVGQCTTLRWNVQGVREIYLDGEGVTGQDTREVCPVATTTYTLRIVLQDGSTTERTVTVNVPDGLGTGDVQVTLRWNNNADMDLYVTEPSGEVIYFGDRNSSTGGQLDRDSNYPCGSNLGSVENVFWPTGRAPAGTYRVEVREFSRCGGGVATWTLTVRVNGQVVLSETGQGTSSTYTFSFSR